MSTESNAGRFVWYENLTRDTKAAIAFYTDVAGWTTEPFGEDYTMWVGSQGPLGGVMKLPEEMGSEVPSHWMAHVLVEDVDDTAARAKSLGGRVLKEGEDIPTVGRFAIIADLRVRQSQFSNRPRQ